MGRSKIPQRHSSIEGSYASERDSNEHRRLLHVGAVAQVHDPFAAKTKIEHTGIIISACRASR